MFFIFTFLLTFSLFIIRQRNVSSSSFFDNPSEVKNLPGLPKISFRHYSGYLNASETHFLHYWFVESQSKPATDPVLLWMNGGPGCSSLDGFLSELGPFLVNEDGATLSLNPSAWNRKANVIFLEAPAGVGFSYSSNGDVHTDDDKVSSENYAALKHFFKMYPKFRNNDFYITGESYGGIYVPTLAVRVIQGMPDFPINLKGVAIGNGMLDISLNTDTIVEFAYNHGLVDEKAWNLLEAKCCGGCADTCDFTEPERGICNNTVTEILSTVYDLGLNMYDLYRDCYHAQVDTYQRFRFDLKWAFPKFKSLLNDIIEKKGLIQRYRGKSGDAPPCLNDTSIRTYLNQPSVQKALHVKENLPVWTVCSETVENGYTNLYKNMYDQFRIILNAGLRIMVYNGDTDMACNFLMNQKFVSKLNLTIIEPKKPWSVNQQIAGFVTSFKGLDFVTVKGTGHMVPQWKPVQAYHMIKSYLENVPL